MRKLFSPFRQLIRFYYNGFRDLPQWGRKVWLIIIIKLFIMFAILRLFFFPDFLKTRFRNDEQRSEYVMEQLINSQAEHD